MAQDTDAETVSNLAFDNVEAKSDFDTFAFGKTERASPIYEIELARIFQTLSRCP
jgi:hypothetical protein